MTMFSKLRKAAKKAAEGHTMKRADRDHVNRLKENLPKANALVAQIEKDLAALGFRLVADFEVPRRGIAVARPSLEPMTREAYEKANGAPAEPEAEAAAPAETPKEDA